MNRNKIKARIIEKGLTQGDVCEEMGITASTLSLKLNGKTLMTLDEVVKLSNILNLDPNEFYEYFFE